MNTVTTPGPTAGRTVNKLKSAEVFALYNWLNNLHATGQMTLTDTKRTLANAATAALGFTVTDHNISGAFDDLNIALPSPALPAEALLLRRVTHLEAIVKKLCSELSVPYTL